MKLIYHITTGQEWENAQTRGEYVAESLATEGFIHCSRQSQLLAVADRYFPGTNDLLVLGIDEDTVSSWLVDEGPVSTHDPFHQELFPHIYGAIPLRAVAVVSVLTKDAVGQFVWPADLPRS